MTAKHDEPPWGDDLLREGEAKAASDRNGTPYSEYRAKQIESESARRPTLAERAQAWSKEVDAERVTTGYPTLDLACRGGFAPPRLVVIGGAPGAAKTTFAVNVAVRAARAGHPTAIYASDEDIDDILQRVGQLHRIDRQLLEHRRAEAIARLAAALEQIPLLEIFDGDEDTVEKAFEWLREHAIPGKPGVFVCDSAQTARTARTSNIDPPRARLDDVMRTIKRTTRTQRLVSLVTSEIGRAYYRTAKKKKDLEELNDLAAFKESGGIEYMAKTCLLMRAAKGHEDCFDVGMPKNRGGQKLVFRLRIDQWTALSETLVAPTELEDDEDEQEEAKLADRRAKRADAARDEKARRDSDREERALTKQRQRIDQQDRAFVTILRSQPEGIETLALRAELKAALGGLRNGDELVIAARLKPAVEQSKAPPPAHHLAKLFRLVEERLPAHLRLSSLSSPTASGALTPILSVQEGSS